MIKKTEAINYLLARNVEEVIEKDHLESVLKTGKKLRVKHGIDPTGEKIHIGRAVVLWKLREFQDLGHQIVLIIGDFTAQIGDPSDKLEKRPFLTKEQVKKNLKDYLPQIGKILDLKKVEVRYNSEWLAKLDFREISELADTFSVQQMIHRRNFKTRWEKNEDISLRETLYPLMQGYDSVAVKADVELGGTDQLFNLLAGRKIQERYGQKPQDILTTKMLLGTDGRKMSTSWGNVINVADTPDEQFGKAMAMQDEEMPNYFWLATRLNEGEIKKYEKELKRGANPKDVKLALAREIVSRYHGAAAAKQAAETWEKTFSKRETPEDAPVLNIPTGKISATEIVLLSKIVKSKGEAWRLVAQGGFEINEEKITDPRAVLTLKNGDVLKIGKRKFFRAKH